MRQTIALVGASGSGKSTIADLIPRFYDIHKGKILIDNKNIKEYKVESLRRMMGIVTQETILLNTSINNNISYGSEMIKDNIVETAKAANALEFIQELDNGFETIIGERGLNFWWTEAHCDGESNLQKSIITHT